MYPIPWLARRTCSDSHVLSEHNFIRIFLKLSEIQLKSILSEYQRHSVVSILGKASPKNCWKNNGNAIFFIILIGRLSLTHHLCRYGAAKYYLWIESKIVKPWLNSWSSPDGHVKWLYSSKNWRYFIRIFTYYFH